MDVKLVVQAIVTGSGFRCNESRDRYCFHVGDVGTLEWRNDPRDYFVAAGCAVG